MSDAVGSMPSFTRSGRPDPSFVRELGLGDAVDRARGQDPQLLVHGGHRRTLPARLAIATRAALDNNGGA